jgi:uncharacterized protein (TIGR02147 family)
MGSKMQTVNPNVFDYADFRVFLKETYEYRKNADSKFSQRFITRQVGASSAGWFADIIQGRIALTGAYMMKLIRLLKLDSEESEYFQLLVMYEQAGSTEEKNLYIGKMIAMKRVNPSIISKEQFEFYSMWYISAVRELLINYDFIDDYSTLSKKLSPAITIKEAKHAILVLRKLGMIEPDGKNFLKPGEPVIKKDSSFKSVHWANFMKSSMELGLGALDRYNKEDRDISSVTVSLSSETYQNACKEIKRLRQKLLSMALNDKKGDKVYQCNVQFFPVAGN